MSTPITLTNSNLTKECDYMNKKTYKTIAIIALVVSIIGLVSFVGGIKPVNIGAFVFPLLVSGIFFWLYKKK